MRERVRRSARVLLRNERGEVLLIRFVVTREGGPVTFWITPGGEIEAGETAARAARREVGEELGLDLSLGEPVHTERNRFEHWGEMMNNHDTFFVASCGPQEPRLLGLTDQERSLMREIRWWTASALRETGEQFFPVWLADWMEGRFQVA